MKSACCDLALSSSPSRKSSTSNSSWFYSASKSSSASVYSNPSFSSAASRPSSVRSSAELTIVPAKLEDGAIFFSNKCIMAASLF